MKSGKVFYILSITAVGLSVFQLWNVLFPRLSAFQFRPAHLTWVLSLIFLKYPLVREGHRFFLHLRILDFVFIFLNIAAGAVILSFDYNDFTYFNKWT